MSFTLKDILHNNTKELLHLETDPGLGCTEPAAIGLCAAAAAALLPVGDIEAIEVQTDPNIFKNAMGVIIPNSGGRCGIGLAAALGACGGDRDLGLQVFSSVTPQALERAQQLMESGRVAAGISQGASGLFIKATVSTGGHRAEAVISGAHDHIESLILNGEDLLAEQGQDPQQPFSRLSELEQWLASLSLEQLVDLSTELDSDDLAYIDQGLRLNSDLVEHGLAHGPGLGVGRSQMALLRQGLLQKDMALWAGLRTAAGIDARMGGVALPAMTLAGSGNQGIAAGIPVSAVAEFAVVEDRAVILRAVTLSYLVTCAIKAGVGRLSPLCGSGVAGGAGAAAGTAYLLGGSLEQIGGALKNHIANLATVICDGAKTGCALKVGEAAGSAVKSGLMALEGCVVRPSDGIIDQHSEQTMRNLATLARQGLAGMDQAILGIMTSKCA